MRSLRGDSEIGGWAVHPLSQRCCSGGWAELLESHLWIHLNPRWHFYHCVLKCNCHLIRLMVINNANNVRSFGMMTLQTHLLEVELGRAKFPGSPLLSPLPLITCSPHAGLELPLVTMVFPLDREVLQRARDQHRHFRTLPCDKDRDWPKEETNTCWTEGRRSCGLVDRWSERWVNEWL